MIIYQLSAIIKDAINPSSYFCEVVPTNESIENC